MDLNRGPLGNNVTRGPWFKSMPRYHLKPETFWFPVFCFPQDVSLLLYKVPIHIERNRHTQRMVMPPQPS